MYPIQIDTQEENGMLTFKQSEFWIKDLLEKPMCAQDASDQTK